MDQLWNYSEVRENTSFVDDWLVQDGEKKPTPHNVPNMAIVNDQGDGDCWEDNSFNINALSGGTLFNNLTPHHLQVPQTQALASPGSLSPYWDNSHPFGFESPTIQQNSPSVPTFTISASPNSSTTENLPCYRSENSLSASDSIDTDEISFSSNSATAETAPQIDASLGRTYQVLSPVTANVMTPQTQLSDCIYTAQSGAAIPSPTTQLPVVATASSSNILVNIGSVPETPRQISNGEALNPGKPTKNSSLGKIQRKKRPPQHKTKLHEVDIPYSDGEKEKKRQNAIKARKNREKLAKEKKELNDENSNLRKLLKERDEEIELLKQQRQQDRFRAIDFHRSELRRLGEEE